MYLISNSIKPSFKYLIFTIVLLLIVPSFFKGTEWQRITFAGLLSLVLLACIFTTGYTKKGFLVAVGLALTMFFVNWLSVYKTTEQFTWLKIVFFLPYFSWITYNLAHYVAKAKRPDENTLYGAIGCYLLLGITSALLFQLIELYAPNSFRFSHEYAPDFQDFLYYSFVTLSTVGYGDITPVSPQAQSFSVTLSITGQIYLTIIIAILIGKYLSQKVAE